MKRHRELASLSQLFALYKDKFRPPQSEVVDVFIEVVVDLYGIELTKKQVTYTVVSRTINLTCSSIIRHELQKAEADILTHIKGRLGEKNAPLVIR